jgi:uncharacterized membrane protein
MVDVLTQIIINRSVEKVSDYAMNPDNAPNWYVNIKSVEWRSNKPLGVGSLIAFKAQFLGKKLAYVYEIRELIPGTKLVMSTADGPFPMETTYTWGPVDHHTTLMKLRNRGNPSGFSKWIAPFMSLAMRKANTNDLKKLKTLLEAGA